MQDEEYFANLPMTDAAPPPQNLPRRPAPNRFVGHILPLTAILLVIFLYLWTARLFEAPGIVQAPGWDQKSYNNLVEGWMQGQLNLPISPPEGIRSFEDVWNSPDSLQLRRQYWDLTIHDGKLYLYFGLTPALLLYAPVRLLGLGYMTDRLAAAVFSILAFLGALALLRHLVRSAGKHPPHWMIVGAILTVGLCGTVPFFLRVTAVYQVAIAAGSCFSVWAVYLFASGLGSGGPVRWRLALGSLCYGLAVAARPTQILWAVLLLVATWHLWRWMRRQEDARKNVWEVVSTLTAIWLPAIAMGMVVAGYNYLRFGSPLEFGTSFQLTSERQGDLPPALESLGQSLYLYLLHPFQWQWEFPFYAIRYQYAVQIPPGLHVEPVAGLLQISPILLALLYAPLMLFSHQPEVRRLSRWIVFIVLTAAAGLLLIILLAVYRIVTMRYLVDFTPLLVACAAAAWILWDGLLRGRRWARLGGNLALCLLLLYSIGANLGLSVLGCGDARCRDYELLQRSFEGPRNQLARWFDEEAAVLLPEEAAKVKLEILEQCVAGTPKHIISEGQLWLVGARVAPAKTGRGRLFLLFECDKPIPKELRVYVHAHVPQEQVGTLPPARQELGFLNWDFGQPDPPVTRWHEHRFVLLSQAVEISTEINQVVLGLYEPGQRFGNELLLQREDLFAPAP